MKIIKWLPIIALLSTVHCISNMNFNTLTMLDYIVLITGIIVAGAYGKFIWGEIKYDR